MTSESGQLSQNPHCRPRASRGVVSLALGALRVATPSGNTQRHDGPLHATSDPMTGIPCAAEKQCLHVSLPKSPADWDLETTSNVLHLGSSRIIYHFFPQDSSFSNCLRKVFRKLVLRSCRTALSSSCRRSTQRSTCRFRGHSAWILQGNSAWNEDPYLRWVKRSWNVTWTGIVTWQLWSWWISCSLC